MVREGTGVDERRKKRGQIPGERWGEKGKRTQNQPKEHEEQLGGGTSKG